jgi:hypothetical protein
MDRHVSIDVDLIAKIIGLPIDEEKPEQYLDEKTKEKSISDEIKNKYGTERGSRGIIIKKINEPATRFVTKLMVCKLLRKCCKNPLHV